MAEVGDLSAFPVANLCVDRLLYPELTCLKELVGKEKGQGWGGGGISVGHPQQRQRIPQGWCVCSRKKTSVRCSDIESLRTIASGHCHGSVYTPTLHIKLVLVNTVTLLGSLMTGNGMTKPLVRAETIAVLGITGSWQWNDPATFTSGHRRSTGITDNWQWNDPATCTSRHRRRTGITGNCSME